MKNILASLLFITLAPPYVLHAQINPRHHAERIHIDFKNTLYIPSRAKIIQQTITFPVILIGAGLYAMTDNEVLNRYEIKEERDEHSPTFRHHLDDYLQYSPIVAVYGLNAMGVNGQNNLANRTALLIKSEMIMSVLTFSLKKLTAVPRPDTGEPTSFPSGHTAQAFAAATFMVKEYGHKNVLYSISAYTVATGIGVMRVMNNRHWASDVLAGAGIGILATNLAYLTHRYNWGKHKTKSASTIVLPSYDGQTGMVNVMHRF